MLGVRARAGVQVCRNGEIDLEDKNRSGRPKIYEDAELEEDLSQTQKELALTLEVTPQAVSHRLKSLGIIHKQVNWVPYVLKPRDVRRRLCTSEMLLARHKKKSVENYLKTLDWEVLPQPPYSPDIAPSDYHLLRSMAHALSEQQFTSYEDTKNWVDS
ncbi:Mariner Mos1 transposase [Eumeta japonica]|uniref:Mariner Mos1 transposase n=1 Tax=Eumeta variegata TaxID=151549 RepID=A0A4C2A5Z7_EUMVA|nr:Mariner Mos1 transposase [Eumeta japonica]